jgi:hypothetical protein
VGTEKFCVGLVALSHQGKDNWRDGLVRNRGNCEPVAPIVVSTMVKVLVVFLTQASLVMLFVILLCRRWNKASKNPASTKKYKDLIREGVVFICNAGNALLIGVG